MTAVGPAAGWSLERADLLTPITRADALVREHEGQRVEREGHGTVPFLVESITVPIRTHEPPAPERAGLEP